jgi:hypothetical protein
MNFQKCYSCLLLLLFNARRQNDGDNEDDDDDDDGAGNDYPSFVTLKESEIFFVFNMVSFLNVIFLLFFFNLKFLLRYSVSYLRKL